MASEFLDIFMDIRFKNKLIWLFNYWFSDCVHFNIWSTQEVIIVEICAGSLKKIYADTGKKQNMEYVSYPAFSLSTDPYIFE